nr:restriction endonuclease subunit S [Actinobacillus minor]
MRLKHKTYFWEQRKLGDAADVRDGTHSSPNYYETGYPLVTSKNLTEYGLDLSDVSFISLCDFNEINKRSKVDEGDILLGLIGTIGNPILVDKSGYAIKNVGLIKEKEELKNIFLVQLLKSSTFNNYIFQKNTGNTQKFLSLDTLRNFNFLCPKIEEQTAIGNFFKQLDETIALHRRNCIKFQNLKTAYLENIFSTKYIQIQNENKNAWEQRKLGEVGYCQSGIGFPEREQGRKKGIPFYKVSDMTLIGNELIMVTSNNYVSEEQILKNRWKVINSIPAIIFAKVGAALLLDRKRLVLNSFLIDNNTMAYILNEQWDYYFCKTLFDTIYLPQLSQVGALPSFNGKDVENLNVIIPKSKEEQTTIGNFFKQLDETIALHQKELAKYQQIKAACLEKMFVK